MTSKFLLKTWKITKKVLETLGDIILIGIFLFWLFEFPICKMQAKAKYREFSAEYQNVTKADIDDIEYEKDYGGYKISATYKSMPDYEYIYSYRKGSMNCTVFKDGFTVPKKTPLEIPNVDGWK